MRSCAKLEKPQLEADEDKKGKAKDVELNYVYVLLEYVLCIRVCKQF